MDGGEPDFWRGQVAIDEVIFRVFRNADAMVAALESGELDAHTMFRGDVSTTFDDRGHRRHRRRAGCFDDLV